MPSSGTVMCSPTNRQSDRMDLHFILFKKSSLRGFSIPNAFGLHSENVAFHHTKAIKECLVETVIELLSVGARVPRFSRVNGVSAVDESSVSAHGSFDESFAFMAPRAAGRHYGWCRFLLMGGSPSFSRTPAAFRASEGSSSGSGDVSCPRSCSIFSSKLGATTQLILGIQV